MFQNTSHLASNEQNYSIGKGRLFFDQFSPTTGARTGELDLGNTDPFEITVAFTKKEHMSSRAGARIIDDIAYTEKKVSVKFTLEEKSIENLLLALKIDVNSIKAGTIPTSELKAIGGPYSLTVSLDRFVQVIDTGHSNTPVPGFVSVSGISGTLGTDYDVEPNTGRIRIRTGNSMNWTEGSSQRISLRIGTTSTGADVVRKVVAPFSQLKVLGYLRFEGTSEVGPQYGAEFWKVQLDMTGALAMISQDFEKMAFDGECFYDDLANSHTSIGLSPFFQITELVAPQLVS